MHKIVISENTLDKKVIIKEKTSGSKEYKKLVEEVNKNIEEVNDAKVYVKAKTFVAR